MEFELKNKSQRITLVDPITNKVIQKYIFFWELPDRIVSLLKPGKVKKNSAKLKEYFGLNWEYYVGLSDKIIDAKPLSILKSASAMETIESDEEDDGFDFDNIIIDNEDLKLDVVMDKDFGITYVTDINLFPKDTLNMIKHKIYYVTNIPVYRQHLFWTNYDGTGHYSSYNLYLHKQLYEFKNDQDTEKVQNIMIDRNLYQERNNLKIRTWELMDTFDSLIGNNVYVYDMDSYMSKIDKTTVYNDNFLSQLIYYGLIIKYFPMLDFIMFRQYLQNEKEMFKNANLINKSKLDLEKSFELLSKISFRIYNNYNSLQYIYDSQISTYINRILYETVYQSKQKKVLNIRNMFDVFKCDKKYYSVNAFLEYKGNWYKATKIYNNAPDMELLLESEYMEFDLSERIYFVFAMSKNNDIGNIIIDSSGNYQFEIVSKNYNISFDDYFNSIQDDVNRLLEYFDKFKDLIFLPTFEDQTLIRFKKKNIRIKSCDIDLKWNKTIDQNIFYDYQKIINKYEEANILTIRENIFNKRSNNYILKFNRGIKKEKTPFILKKNAELRNYYDVFRDNNINRLWNLRYSGVLFEIVNGVTNVKFTLENIDGESYERCKMFIMSLIFDFSEITKSNIPKEKKLTSTKKKMEELDPDLYKFITDSGLRYARLCQKKFQPVGVFTPTEYKQLGDKENTHKFYNYTTKEPIYYKCPKQFPNLGYIVGKHPKNYCIPRCKETETEGEKNKQIGLLCNEKKIVKQEDITVETLSSLTIIKFGKEIEKDRFSYLHDSLYKFFKITNEKQLMLANYSKVGTHYSIQLLEAYAKYRNLTLELLIDDIISKFTQDIYNSIRGEINLVYSDIINVISNIKSGNEFSFDWYNFIINIIHYIYGDLCIIFKTVIYQFQEILNSSNSYINILINKGINMLSINKNNLLMFLIIEDDIYPIVENEDIRNNFSPIIVNTLIDYYKNKNKKDPDLIMFNNYSKIRSIIKETPAIQIENQYILNNKTYILLAKKKSKYFTIGCFPQSIKSGPQSEKIERIFGVFNRKKHNIDPKTTIEFALEYVPLESLVFICYNTKLEKIVKPDDNNKCNFIGFRIKDVYSWFNDCTLENIQKIIGRKKVKIEFMNYDIVDVNNKLQNPAKQLPVPDYIQDIHYKIYIYKLFKNEFFRVLQMYKDPDIHKQISEILKNNNTGRKIVYEIKNKFPYSSDKLSKIILSSSSKKTELINNILFKEDLIALSEKLDSINFDKMIKNISSNICNFITELPTIEVFNNSIISEITIEGSINIKLGTANIKHIKTKYSDNEGLFYYKGKLNILKNMYDDMSENLKYECQNKKKFLSNIFNPSINIVNNFFQFNIYPDEKIIIKSI